MLDDPSLEKQILRPPQASRIAVLADTVHETPVHRRWLDFFGKMESWLDRYRIMPEASSR